ncbi:hypothetical protein Y1Q_0005258 [Alligator mississippiensis]|uniref:Uncharacterized protein n=1 Tax=Alligator mississippiensis TaxID=8496 RepID=A0A151MT69_ALLMI|nr:hypothetical protein Y1Q_0005258 [Alligator mississippiensis]
MALVAPSSLMHHLQWITLTILAPLSVTMNPQRKGQDCFSSLCIIRQSRGYYHCVQTMEDCYQSKKSEDSYPCRLLKLHLLLKQSWRLVCLSSSKKDTKTYSKAVNGLVVNVLICEEGNPGPVLNQGVSLLLSKLILKDGE